MYNHTNSTFPRADVIHGHHHHHSDLSLPDLTVAPAPSLTHPHPPPAHLLIPDQLPAPPMDYLCGGHSSSSGCSGSPSSLASCATQRPSFIQRSNSSHSLPRNTFHCHFLDLDTNPVRRVFSTGDLHVNSKRLNYQHGHKEESPISSESSVIIESMNRACKYSPEEKKERIERYRSKRSLRNFNKKIKYVCRKTLADSRPRIRGRFAKNDEIEKMSQHQWSNVSGDEDEDDDDNWINFLDAFSANSIP